MIDEVVPPLVPGSLVSATVVETSTNDHGLRSPVVSGPPRNRAVSGPFPVWLPDSMLDELQLVAEQEGREVAEIVTNAVEEFLADHWAPNSDL